MRLGRPTIRKNGIPFTAAENMRRYRLKRKRDRKRKSNEWYTPKEYVESARKAMGCIDLDPASHDLAQTVVKATTYFTVDDDGLSKAWHGNVFLNPPYSKTMLIRFIDKLLEEIAAGRTQQAILLVQSSSAGTQWFHKVQTTSQGFCLLDKRIYFWSPYAADGLTPKGNKAGLAFGTMIFYFGNDGKRFESVFKQFGIVVRKE